MHVFMGKFHLCCFDFIDFIIFLSCDVTKPTITHLWAQNGLICLCFVCAALLLETFNKTAQSFPPPTNSPICACVSWRAHAEPSEAHAELGKRLSSASAVDRCRHWNVSNWLPSKQWLLAKTFLVECFFLMLRGKKLILRAVIAYQGGLTPDTIGHCVCHCSLCLGALWWPEKWSADHVSNCKALSSCCFLLHIVKQGATSTVILFLMICFVANKWDQFRWTRTNNLNVEPQSSTNEKFPAQTNETSLVPNGWCCG